MFVCVLGGATVSPLSCSRRARSQWLLQKHTHTLGLRCICGFTSTHPPTHPCRHLSPPHPAAPPPCTPPPNQHNKQHTFVVSYLSLIINQAVFNYEFDSLTHDDPVIQAVYTALREAEYRSTGEGEGVRGSEGE